MLRQPSVVKHIIAGKIKSCRLNQYGGTSGYADIARKIRMRIGSALSERSKEEYV